MTPLCLSQVYAQDNDSIGSLLISQYPKVDMKVKYNYILQPWK